MNRISCRLDIRRGHVRGLLEMPLMTSFRYESADGIPACHGLTIKQLFTGQEHTASDTITYLAQDDVRRRAIPNVAEASHHICNTEIKPTST